MIKRLMFLILSLAVLVGMGLATTAAIAGDGLYGQMRWRWEGWNNATDQNGDGDDAYGYNFMRTRLGYSTEIGERGMFNLSLENTRLMGGDYYYYYTKSFWDDSSNNLVDVHEAYMGVSDFLFDGFDAYAGRFSLSYGRERVIGPEDWSMYWENRFDGFKGHYAFEKGWLDILCLKLYETFTDKYDYYYDDWGTGDMDLRGVYAHFDAAEGMYVEPYVMMMTQDNYDENDNVGNDNYFIFGALFDYMSDMGLHFYAEGLMQTGTAHGGYYDEGDAWVTEDYDVSTLGFYTGLFYEFDSTVKPFIGAEFNYASGTKADDEKDKTFMSPFGSFSTYMGIQNIVAWSNTASFRFSGGLTPVEGTDVKLDFYMFKLAQEEDGLYTDPSPWYDIPGRDSAEKGVGTEIDFFVNHKIEDGVTLEGGVSMFSFGDYFGVDNDYDSILYGWLGGQVEF